MKESYPSEYDNELNRQKDSKEGDKALEDFEDLSEAYIYYIRGADKEGLKKIAERLREKGEENKAKKIEEEIGRLKELDN